MRIEGWVAALVLCGCGDPEPKPIEICADSTTFARYRDGDGPWLAVSPDARGINVLEVTDDFEYIAVRVQSGGLVFWYAVRATVDETLALRDGRPTSCPAPDAQRFAVSGQLAQPAEVAMGGRGVTLTAPGPFTLSVGRGVHDLFATTGNSDPVGGRIVVRRDLSIEAATTVPAIDLATEGSPFLGVPITASGLASGNVPSTSVYLIDTRNNDVAFVSDGTGATAAAVPRDLLGATTDQWISLSAGSQLADVLYTGTAPSVELLPPLTGITFARANGLSAAWSSLPISSYTHAQLTVIGSTMTSTVLQYQYATRGWLSGHGATSIAFDQDVSGLDPAWRLDTTKPFDATFSLTVDTPTVSLATHVTTDETMTPRTRPLPAPALVARRALRF